MYQTQNNKHVMDYNRRQYALRRQARAINNHVRGRLTCELEREMMRVQAQINPFNPQNVTWRTN